MTPRAELARAYLRPLPGSFWCWAERGDVIAWIDGTTIAFRDELQELLARLAPEGLPPFETLVAALALTGDGWRQGSIAASLSAELTSDTLALAERVALLPAELRRGIDAKSALVRFLCAGCERAHEAPEARELARQMRAELEVDDLLPTAVWYPKPVALEHPLTPLLPRLAQLDEQSLRSFARTGLEEPPPAAEVALPDSALARRLLLDLGTDPERRGLARAARTLMATLRLPRPLLDRTELSFGGIADLSHRGPLDRLLVSELAHDDLTLSARLAAGEALYLERERPPAHPGASRALLVDGSLRMWGLPRLFAAACALGLAAGADPRGRVRAFRARGRRALEVELTSRGGLEELLAALETDAHPGAALADFVQRARTDHSQAGPLALIVLTSERALEDREFLDALDAQRGEELLIATLARSGRLRLVACGPRGRRTLQEMELDLAALAPAPDRRALLDEARTPEVDPALPALLRVRPFPLLLPFELEPGRFALMRDGSLLAFLHDRRVMHRAHQDVGGRELGALPGGRMLAFHVGREARAWIVCERQGTPSVALLTIDVERGECAESSLALSARGPRGSFVDADELVVVLRSGLDVFSLETGELRAHVELGPRSWLGGRSFRGLEGEVELYSGSGAARGFEALPRPAGGAIASCLDVPGREGPLVADLDGALWWSASRERPAVRPLGRGVLLVAASRDGRRALATRGERRLAIDLESGTVTVFERPQGRALPVDVGGRALQLALEPELGPYLRGDWGPSTRARSVLCQADGRLHVRIASTRWSYSPAHRRFEPWSDDPNPLAVTTGREYPFGRSRRQSGTHVALRGAVLRDGSRLVHDSRGLLHVVPAERELPEFALLVQYGELTGWIADGGVFGASWNEGGPRVDPARAHETLERVVRSNA